MAVIRRVNRRGLPPVPRQFMQEIGLPVSVQFLPLPNFLLSSLCHSIQVAPRSPLSILPATEGRGTLKISFANKISRFRGAQTIADGAAMRSTISAIRQFGYLALYWCYGRLLFAVNLQPITFSTQHFAHGLMS